MKERRGDNRYETRRMVWHFCVMRVDIVDFYWIVHGVYCWGLVSFTIPQKGG